MSFTNEKKQYSYGYSDSQKKLQSKRNLETYGQFIKPYLKPGLSVLDCGCGQGTMTIDFAKFVNPGQVIGIDISEEMLQLGIKSAQQKEINNIKFQPANVYELPFEDNSFDIVYVQTLLSHIAEPLRAIKEMKRVTKSGGILAAKEIYLSSWFIYPENKLLQDFMRFRMHPIIENGGDLDIGIKLYDYFKQIKFSDIDFKMTCFNHDGEDAGQYFADEIMKYPNTKKMLAEGKVTKEKTLNYQQAWLDFAKTPGAWSGVLYGEVIGRT